jgi:zinc finger MYND domain-containing protein 10
VVRVLCFAVCCQLPLSVMVRILDGHDAIQALVQLLEEPPWTQRTAKGLLKFEDYKWKAVAPDDMLILSKTEAQVWLCLYNLLIEPQCRKHYQWNTQRKDCVVRVRHVPHSRWPLS